MVWQRLQQLWQDIHWFELNLRMIMESKFQFLIIKFNKIRFCLESPNLMLCFSDLKKYIKLRGKFFMMQRIDQFLIGLIKPMLLPVVWKLFLQQIVSEESRYWGELQEDMAIVSTQDYLGCWQNLGQLLHLKVKIYLFRLKFNSLSTNCSFPL